MEKILSIPDDVIWREGRLVVDVLITAGFETYAAGGCVRDLVLGNPVHDIDIATAAPPDDVENICAHHGWQTIAVGKAFGVVVVVVPSGQHVEVATFRHDGAYTDGRRPTSVTFSTAREDVERRDFTINALLLDVRDGRVIDYVDGLRDIEAHLVRAVGDAAARLDEDRLRVLRALRFSARLNFSCEQTTWDAIVQTTLQGVSRERIIQEWEKAMGHASRATWFELLRTSGHLPTVCAPLAETSATAHGVLRECLQRTNEHEDRSVLLALWLCPVDHDTSAAWLDQQPIASDWKRETLWLLTHHLEYLRTLSLPDRRRAWRHPAGQALARLLTLRYGSQADDLVAEQAHSLTLDIEPLLRANDLIALGVVPGPALGALLRRLEDEQLAGRITSRDAALSTVQGWLAAGKKSP